VAQLQRVFDIGELPTSGVDLGRAVRAGRRRERIRSVAVAGTAALTVLAVVAAVAVVDQRADRSRRAPGGSPASPQGQWTKPGPVQNYQPGPASPPLGICTYQTLVAPDIGEFLAMDPGGRIIAGKAGDGSGDIIRIEDGHSERISPPGGGETVVAVNRGGDLLLMAGSRYVVYQDGAFKALPESGAGFSNSATDINDHGAVAVDLRTPERDGSVFKAAVWPADRPAALVLLDTPAGWSSRATAIHNDGVVVGYLERVTDGSTAASDATPVYWDKDGIRHDLPAPAGVAATAVRDRAGDWVLARSVRWNLRTGGIDVLKGILGERIDEDGRVFGEVPDLAPPRPGTWVNGVVTLLPVDPAAPLGMIGQVSGDGRRIIGTTSNDVGDVSRRLDWTCR
jgi:hypothetical protein